MKFLRDVKQRIANSKWFGKLKKVKNLEIVIAVALAAVAIVIYVALSFCGSGKRPTEPQIQMTEKEARVARMISEIAGVGEARVLITGEDNAVVGVVIVAEGADKMDNRIKMIRLASKATGATVDQIEIFEMAKGG